MMKSRVGGMFVFLSSLVLLILAAGIGPAAGADGLAGWGKEDAYNKLYNAKELDQFKGNVEEIKEGSPMSGMAPGVILRVKDQDKEMVEVHVGPKAYVNIDSIGLKIGDRIKVRGVWADIDGKEIFMASKLKKGDNLELKVRRTRDGVPYWTMTPEEVAKEKEEQ